MKINHSTSSRPADAAAGDAARPQAAPAADATDAAPSAGLSVSPLAAQVRDISARLAQPTDDDIDTAKVEEIRQAIAEGRIKIDPGKIADGLLATLRELGQADAK
ncbi:Putative negative regulator of flagellin synthesis, anti-sigma-28 factor [Cupriavidus taiwanensis]|uniref:Negative regulator of flagellin synthesis n=1 Tax=Cupriavidus taiwanensis TaxID=164546 RepID=A0A375EBZ4_9BURK|nr:flagellar biosynthesis anti-sigma factor FlgM [Cupriavidus taiwanensis]SOZ68455.1 Putative negative regulator of flagellin synthesis, anti-sigma-28 factor [Cupriavidus taiwanensis]SOZ69663.1 Putative negative regulator of flagellin synthesis, anti-sigma-28 factor [Cupriavidus taiwanensis]SOZ72875.1 Putative negative regulator of flagellin synthesis, anti-sigma-28 factor [Cupriavidus taiwanensis]SPA09733.1 Putative negative regulator of flagellin synthesis, anti-sigma-28 factor [Cupriavidus t